MAIFLIYTYQIFFEKDLYLSNNNLIDLIKLLAFNKICNHNKRKFIIYGCPNSFESYLVEFINLNASPPENFLKKNRYINNPFLQVITLSLLLFRFNLLFIRSLVIKVLMNLLSFKRESIKNSKIIFLIISCVLNIIKCLNQVIGMNCL